MVFGLVADVAVERHRIRDPSSSRVPDEPLRATSRRHDVEVQARAAAAEARNGVERVLDLLVRHQPGQHRHPRRARPRLGQRLRRRFVQPIADHRDRSPPPRVRRDRARTAATR